MSTALYRRYRPETFAQVIGQEHVTNPLMAALNKDRINHAYLFSGPRGCGKTTSARILARCLNCEQGPTATPCGVCASCRDLARGGGGSLDVVEIDAASHGGVDDARSLRERAVFAPARDRFKVFIIDEAHMVSTQGFNALLKIVEEPPPHIRFVFATTEPDKVIGTIRSRTHHYPFRLVPPERLQNYLAELCTAEDVEVGQGVLPLVVRAGAGSVRDSLSVLDQLIAGAGPEGLTYPLAVSLLGYTDATLLDDVVDALAVGDGATVFQVVDRVIESGHDPRRFVEDLLERLRDLLVVAAVPDGGHAVLRALPADQLRRMQEQAGRFGRAELSRAADVVNAALTEMTGATSPRLQLELLCARLLLPAAEETERGLRARVDRIEKRLGVVSPGMPLAAPVGAAVGPAVGSAGSGAGRPEPVRAPGERPAARVERPVEAVPAERPAPAVERPQTSDDAPAAGAQVASAPPPAPPTPEPDGWGAPAGRPDQQVDVPAPAATGGARGGGPGGGPDTATVRRLWPDVLTALSGLKRATWSLVSQHAQVVDFDGERLMLGFGSPGLAATFGRGAHAEFLRQALIEVVGLDCAIEAVAGDRGSIRAPQPAAQTSAPAQRAQSRSEQRPESRSEQRPEQRHQQSAPTVAPAVPSVQSAPEHRPAPEAAARPAPLEEPAGWGPTPTPTQAPSPAVAPAPASAPPRSSAAAAAAPADRPRRPMAVVPDDAPPADGAGGGGRPGRAAAGGGAATRGASDDAGRGGNRPRGRSLASVPPYDDIPPPDEPPPDDDIPPEDDGWRPPPDADAATPAAAPAPAAPAPAAGRSASAATRSASGTSRPDSASARSAPVPAADRPAPRTAPRDDEVSFDDADVEGSSLVGAPVVEQLLGGRLIDEREE